MSINKIVTSMKSTRLIAIDPSSHSLAWSVIDLDKGKFDIVATGKIDFKNDKEIYSKLRVIRKEIKDVWSKYQFKEATIEQSVYIQNFQSSRIISYIIGYTWGVLDEYCHDVCDINPMVWKNKIGYKNISKEDKQRITSECGGKGVQKRLTQERKDRVKRIIEKQVAFSTEDDDINDSLGIALWYYIDRGYGTLQR